MSRPNTAPLVRVLLIMLVLAVVLCLVLPMAGDDGAGMSLALVCCFVLAIALSVFVVRRPQPALLLKSVLDRGVPLARGPTQTARAPDLFALGSILI